MGRAGIWRAKNIVVRTCTYASHMSITRTLYKAVDYYYQLFILLLIIHGVVQGHDGPKHPASGFILHPMGTAFGTE